MQDVAAERTFYDDLFRRKPDNEHITSGYDELYELAFREEPRGALLDLGCGTGAHAVRLARRGYDVVAVDLTVPGVRSTRRRFEVEGLKGRFLVADAEQLPFRGESFDVVWSSLLLHHFPKLDVLPAELARVARRRVIAFEPNAHNLLTWFAFNVANRWFGWVVRRFKRFAVNQRALWPGRLTHTLRGAGLRRTRLHYVDRVWDDRMGLARRVYRALLARLPIRFRANKFLMVLDKVP